MAKTYRSFQGKEIDMDKIMSNNELMPAVGNVKVNARGDELGPGGKIVKKREQIMSEYYERTPPKIKEPISTLDKKELKPTIENTQSDSITKRGNYESKRQTNSVEE